MRYHIIISSAVKMSEAQKLFSSYPQQVIGGPGQASQTYSLKPGFYAVHNRQPGTTANGARYTFNDGTIAVFQGAPDQSGESDASEKLSPVYSLEPGGSLAVPTGLIFIRLRDGLAIDERLEEIKRAGFEITERLAYAPNAVWLRANSNLIADALKGIDKLKEIPDVENVEPQMLMESARR